MQLLQIGMYPAYCEHFRGFYIFSAFSTYATGYSIVPGMNILDIIYINCTFISTISLCFTSLVLSMEKKKYISFTRVYFCLLMMPRETLNTS